MTAMGASPALQAWCAVFDEDARSVYDDAVRVGLADTVVDAVMGLQRRDVLIGIACQRPSVDGPIWEIRGIGEIVLGLCIRARREAGEQVPPPWLVKAWSLVVRGIDWAGYAPMNEPIHKGVPLVEHAGRVAEGWIFIDTDARPPEPLAVPSDFNGARDEEDWLQGFGMAERWRQQRRQHAVVPLLRHEIVHAVTSTRNALTILELRARTPSLLANLDRAELETPTVPVARRLRIHTLEADVDGDGRRFLALDRASATLLVSALQQLTAENSVLALEGPDGLLVHIAPVDSTFGAHAKADEDDQRLTIEMEVERAVLGTLDLDGLERHGLANIGFAILD